MRPTIRRLCFAAPFAFLAALLITSCQDDPSGPLTPIPEYFAIAPAFESEIAGIVPLGSVRVLISRTSDSSVALVTVVQIARDSDTLVTGTLLLRRAQPAWHCKYPCGESDQPQGAHFRLQNRRRAPKNGPFVIWNAIPATTNTEFVATDEPFALSGKRFLTSIGSLSNEVEPS